MAKRKKKNPYSDCTNCENCVYVGDGDYICNADVPRIVLKNWNEPGEDYMWCGGDLLEEVDE